jgi:glycerol-3-phosphate acyltransferase PlsY
MQATAVIAIAVLAAYLLGSGSFAVLVSKLMGMPDPRSYGSRNPGATNVLRTGKKLAAALTLLGDAGKGLAAVLIARAYLDETAAAGYDIPLVGLAAFVGHLYPVFHRFQGGKGVATAAGVLLGFDVWLGLATIATWVAIALFFRLSSLAALVGSIFAPLYAWWLFGLRPVLAAVSAIALLLIWRHRGNIARLLAGEETRIGEESKSAERG